MVIRWLLVSVLCIECIGMKVRLILCSVSVICVLMVLVIMCIGSFCGVLLLG